jgi:hypothetical protein
MGLPSARRITTRSDAEDVITLKYSDCDWPTLCRSYVLAVNAEGIRAHIGR